MIVQVISSPVCPWIGGPSSKSSSRSPEPDDRVDHHRGNDREDEMQIAITNQNVKAIRPACCEASSGSQVGTTATAVATPPAISASPKSATMEPLRIRVGA